MILQALCANGLVVKMSREHKHKHQKRQYLCACEGQQEELYLKHLGRLINELPGRKIKFVTVIHPPRYLEKVNVSYDCVALFDHDSNDKTFQANITICDKLNKKEMRKSKIDRRRIWHAYSNLNFDLWLILHKEDFSRCVYGNDQYADDVRRIYGLAPTDNIKSKDTLANILNCITLENIESAISRANALIEQKLEGDKKIISSSICCENPDLSIHRFIRAVIDESKIG